MVGSFRGSAEALWFGSSQTGGNIYDPDGDRRLPMMRLSEDIQSRRLVYENEEIDGWIISNILESIWYVDILSCAKYNL